MDIRFGLDVHMNSADGEKQNNSEQIKVYFGLYSIVVIINKAGFGIWKKCFVMLNLNH